MTPVQLKVLAYVAAHAAPWVAVGGPGFPTRRSEPVWHLIHDGFLESRHETETVRKRVARGRFRGTFEEYQLTATYLRLSPSGRRFIGGL